MLLSGLEALPGKQGPGAGEHGPGCEEKFDAEFILWLLWGGRSGKKREEHRRLRERFPHKMTVCRSRKEIAALLCEKL